MQNFSDPFAETKIEKITVGSKEVDSKIAICVKGDDGEFHAVGFRSTDYNLITNQRANDVATDIMSRSGHTWKNLKTLWDGKKFVQYFITEKPIATVETIKTRPIHLGLMVRNAYDGSGAFGEEIYACDYTCMNQFISRNRFGYFVIYHDDSKEFLIEDAVQNLSAGMKKVIDIAPKLRSLASAPISVNHIKDAYKKTSIPESMWGKVIERLGEEESTLFGFYCAMTFISSHNIRGFNQIAIGNSISDYFLDNGFDHLG